MSSRFVVNRTVIQICPNTGKFYLLCRTTCFDLSQVTGSQLVFKTYWGRNIHYGSP